MQQSPTTARAAARALCRLLLLGAVALAKAAPVTVLVEPNPPFIIVKQTRAAGPFVDAFQQLVRTRGLTANVLLTPIRRALQSAGSTPGVCVLGLNYAPANAEVLMYLDRIAPIYVWAYALQGRHVDAHTLADLKHYSVGTIDMAEVREMLDSAGVRYDSLTLDTKGFEMLSAHRFDILLSDLGTDVTTDQPLAGFDRLFQVTHSERWLACNPQTDPATLVSLRAALQQGVFAPSVADIWARYGLTAYYNHVRQDWVPQLTGKGRR